MDIILALITNMSPWFGLAVAGIAISCTVIIVTYMSVKPNKLSHAEAMARIETQHRENMIKIGKENPKVIENKTTKSKRDDY